MKHIPLPPHGLANPPPVIASAMTSGQGGRGLDPPIFKRPNWGAIFGPPLGHVYIEYQPSDLNLTSDIVPSRAFYGGLEDL